jgi:uncharacterized protein
MLNRLPDFVDPIAFAEKNARLDGRVGLAQLGRIQNELMDVSGDVQVQLDFRREGRLVIVDGVIGASLKLQCQRCLEPLDWPVRSVVSLGVVRSLDEAERLSERYEPLLVDESEQISPKAIAEDELLLALPLFPHHDHCREVQTEPPPERQHPFAGLSALLKSHTDSN